MTTRYTKINASDYEDGVVIFKKVTDGEGNATFQQLTAEEMQTELGAVDPNNYDANTFLFVEDDGSGINNIVSPQSISEVKSLLGISEQIYEAKLSFGSTNANSYVFKNSFSDDFVFTKIGTGAFQLVNPNGESKNYFHHKFEVLANANNYEIVKTFSSNGNILFDIKSGGVNTNPASTVEIDITLKFYRSYQRYLNGEFYDTYSLDE